MKRTRGMRAPLLLFTCPDAPSAIQGRPDQRSDPMGPSRPLEAEFQSEGDTARSGPFVAMAPKIRSNGNGNLLS